jgi:hypothetical protein
VGVSDRIFRLQPYGKISEFRYVVLTPEPTDVDKVSAAWAYAIRYTAKGLDLPDHEAALQLLLQRHPSWQLIESLTPSIPINLVLADTDLPEVT